MKNVIFVFLSFLMFSCVNPIDKPKNLIDENTMAELVAELAINEQMGLASPDFQPDNQTRYLFQQRQITVQNFKDSYTYYVSNNKIEKIYNKAMKIILEKDPKAKSFIEKREKENKVLLDKTQKEIENKK